ncbi:MAG: hypothetical protein ACP5E5_04145 [Acidobacteriaceae bacterium]
MRKRKLIPLLIAALLLCTLGVMLYLRAKAPPEAARLLPESDAIVYINLKAIRSLTHFDQRPIERSPDFQHFIDATGILPERDLDAVALALHHMPDPTGPNGPVAYSEVFQGRFDGVRLAHYLASIATSTENFADRTIYTIPVDGRHLRIAQVAYDTIVASNMPTPEQIHSMIDRSRAGALSTPGSRLLAARYRDVPILSEVWGIGRIGLPFSNGDEPDGQAGFISILGLQLPLRSDTVFVASLRYAAAAHVLQGGAVHLRIEEFAPDEATAKKTVDAIATLLGILRGIGNEAASSQPQNSSAAAMRAILNSINLHHRGSRAILKAAASIEQLKALTAAHDPATLPMAHMGLGNPVPNPPKTLHGSHKGHH